MALQCLPLSRLNVTGLPTAGGLKDIVKDSIGPAAHGAVGSYQHRWKSEATKMQIEVLKHSESRTSQ